MSPAKHSGKKLEKWCEIRLREHPFLKKLSVQAAVLDRFRHVFRQNGLGLFQVGDRAGDFQNTVVRAHAEAERFERSLHQPLRFPPDAAYVAQQTAGQFAVKPDAV